MNANFQSLDTAAIRPIAAANLPRRDYRARDFGIGYGTSSGYFSQRRYTGSSFAPRFRCS